MSSVICVVLILVLVLLKKSMVYVSGKFGTSFLLKEFPHAFVCVLFDLGPARINISLLYKRLGNASLLFFSGKEGFYPWYFWNNIFL